MTYIQPHPRKKMVGVASYNFLFPCSSLTKKSHIIDEEQIFFSIRKVMHTVLRIPFHQENQKISSSKLQYRGKLMKLSLPLMFHYV